MKFSDEYYMKLALEEAKAAYQAGEIPVGAVIVKEATGEIIAKAHNMVEESGCSSSHAEMLCIKEAELRLKSKWLTGCTMYLSLEPCAMCAGALVLSRIDRLCIAALDPKTGAACSLYNILNDDRLNHRVEVCYDILSEESSNLIKQFFKELRTKSF